MLATLTEILGAAAAGGYAVIAPDFISINSLKLQISIAEDFGAPVIASYPHLPLSRFYLTKRRVRKMRELCSEASVPVCLHLDHGKSLRMCRQAARNGFTGIMYDGSALDFAANASLTSEAVSDAAVFAVPLEAEIGHVGAASAGIEGGAADRGILTDPDQAKLFAEITGAAALAVSIGTAHGSYSGEPVLDFGRLETIESMTGVPLVLHGGSGTGMENLKKAVLLGIRKINLFTVWFKPWLRFRAGLIFKRPALLLNRERLRSEELELIRSALAGYYEISGSAGKAEDVD